VTQFVSLPSPEEYTPENLAVVAYTDPLYFAKLGAVASLVSYSLGAVYMAQFVPPNTLGLSLGIAQSLALGGPDRLVAKILIPLASRGLVEAKLILSYAGQCGIGVNVPCGAIVYAQHLAQRAVDAGLIKKVPPEVGAIVAVVARNIDLIKDYSNINNFKAAWLWSRTAAAMKEIAALFDPGTPRDAVNIAANALKLFAKPIEFIAASGTAGIPDALDSLSVDILGFSPIAFKNAVKQGVQQAKDFLSAHQYDDTKRQIVQKIGNAFKGMVDGLANVELFGIGDEINKLIRPALDALGQMNGIFAQAQSITGGQLPTGQSGVSSTTTATPTTALDYLALIKARNIIVQQASAQVTPVVPRVPVKPPPVPSPSAPEAQKGAGALVLAAAGTGFLVGGPPGALVGGLLGLAMGKKK